jgi:hypothetical protein
VCSKAIFQNFDKTLFDTIKNVVCFYFHQNNVRQARATFFQIAVVCYQFGEIKVDDAIAEIVNKGIVKICDD